MKRDRVLEKENKSRLKANKTWCHGFPRIQISIIDRIIENPQWTLASSPHFFISRPILFASLFLLEYIRSTFPRQSRKTFEETSYYATYEFCLRATSCNKFVLIWRHCFLDLITITRHAWCVRLALVPRHFQRRSLSWFCRTCSLGWTSW